MKLNSDYVRLKKGSTYRAASEFDTQGSNRELSSLK